MRRILSERNIVVLLFLSALAFFAIAQEDAKRIKSIYLNPAVTEIPPSPPQEAKIEVKAPAQLPAGSAE